MTPDHDTQDHDIPDQETPDHEVVIVGAGFGGMGAAIEFDRLGVRDLVILEREDDLGGTWHVNRYPGLAVDIASVTYSYSFEPNPHWSRLFAPGAELKRYAEHVADKYRLRSRMRFGMTVEGAEWDERARLWRVRVAGRAELTARYLVTATGFLSQPHTPDIPGVDGFAGEVIHTAAWPEGVELAGRRVAVIGTGATAVQLVPELAREVAELTVYQRTPIWVVPKVDGAIPAPVRALFARFPVAQRAARLVNTALLEALMVVGVLRYRKARPVAGLAARLGRWHLRRQVPDPVLRRALTPDYDFGCKRPTFSNTYFRAFTRPHVHLVTETIERIEPGGIIAGGVSRPVDVLVLATGFDLWEVNFPAIAVIGRGGRELGPWWRGTRFQAYEGISVPRFPNFLTLASPYSYSGLSYFTTIETQMRHIRRLFGELARTGSRVFEVREDANERFLEKVTARLEDSVFYAGDCATARSYYFNQHGEAAILRPSSTVTALREAGRFPLADYTYAR